MVDIDERVVQMKFDATDFDQNTKKTMSTLDKLRDKLSFKDVVDNDAMNSIADNVQKVADKAYTIVDRVIDKIKDNIANKLVNFLQENTIGQISAGWNKYADLTTAVATLKAQGYAMEEINDQLARLNYFTDETSYNFTAMVGEIGKFTASGQKLEDATTAMMGIADWAALSGKNANEASRAMFQLSQALGAGKIRKEDWKSIQNLNMDTREFRENAIEAALAIGTLKDNLNGTYTTLIGKKANKLSFNINQFTDNLTEGEWFTTDVMMQVFSKYSEAVDDIRAIYDSGEYQGKAIHTTAEAVKAVQKSNEDLIAKFNKKELNGKSVTSILERWKKVQKVTDDTVKAYAKANKLTEEQARNSMNKQYAEYLKEYSEIFTNSEKSAEKALDDWHNYVSEFGIKAFLSAQEAKTFTEAIESAKDAASTVWTTIYTTVFGDYNEAKEIWTDLANSLYEIFVDRLWDLSDIFTHWKSEIEEDARGELKKLRKQYNELKNQSELTEEDEARLAELKKQIKSLKGEIQSGLLNGRRVLFQGIYAFGSGFKSIITNFREGWYSLYGDDAESGRKNMVNSSGEKLMTFSEKLRAKGFEFYKTMKRLGETDFYKNVAKGVQNILSPIKAIVTIIKSVINQFIPSGDSFVSTLVKISEGFVNLTSKIVPSQQTITNVARVLRGIVAVIKLIGKAAVGVYNALLKPIISALWDFISGIASGILEVLAEIADGIFVFEEGLDTAEAMAEVGKTIGKAVRFIFDGLSKVFGLLLRGLAPVLRVIVNTIKDIVNGIKELFTGGKGNVIENLADGFNKIATRAKEAWNSVGKLSDVFNKYKGGTGLSNFIKMIGEMLDTIVTKIGVTILSIFGLEEATAKGRMADAINTMKDVIINFASVVRWIYTNILRPVLSTFIEGLAVMIRDLGNQWRSGDVKGILTTLREIIKTFTSLQLFKMFNVITKVFGSGGLLRLMRNGAKAFKGLTKWLGAKALNEIASGVMKLAMAFVILAAAATALTFLPEENLKRFYKVMIVFASALVASMVAMFLITLVADRAQWGLLNFALAMFSVVATVTIFIIAIKKLHDLMTNLFVSKGKDKNGNDIVSSTPEILIGLLSAIAPILTVIGSILVIMKIIKAVGGTGIFAGFALSIAGLAIGVSMLVSAMDNMIDMIMQYDLSLILLSMGMILLFFVGLAAMTRVIGTFNIADKKAFSGIAAGISMAITIAALALTIRMVLIPTLDTIIENSSKFPQYVAGMILILLSMAGIMGTIALINYKSGFWKNMSAVLLIIVVMNYIKNVVVPLLRSFSENPIGPNAMDSIWIISIMMFAIAGVIYIIAKGIAKIIEAVAKIDFKAFGYCILMIGAVILGVIGLNAILESNGIGMDIATVGIILGVIAAVLIMFGIFGHAMAKSFKDGSLLAFSKVLQGIALVIGTLALGIMLILAEFKLLYADNTAKGITIMGSFLLGITLSLMFIFKSFANSVKVITQSMSILSLEGADRIKSMFKMLSMVIMTMIAGILLVVAETKLFDNPWTILIPILSLLGSLTLSLYVIFWRLDILINALSDAKFNDQQMAAFANIVKGFMTGLTAILLSLSIGIALIGGIYDNRTDAIVPAITLAVAATASFVLVALAIGHMVKQLKSAGIKFDDYAKIQGFIITIGVVIAALAGLFAIIIGALSGQEGNNNIKNAVAVFAPILLLFWSFVLALKMLTPIADAFLGTGLKLAAVIAAIAAALILLGTAFAVIKEIFAPGSTFLSNGGFAVGKNFADSQADGIRSGKRNVLNAIDELNEDSQDETEEVNNMHSPSKVYRKYGYFIDKGLELGIKKDTRLAVSAAKALATSTNKSFQKELGIASPSKVFYENGKFVIRGFINGAQSEYQKNKDIGSAIGEGFAEEAQKGITDAYKDIFMNKDMDEYIKNAGTDMGSTFVDSIFGKINGTTEEVHPQLTADEQYGISLSKNKIADLQKEIDELNANPPISGEDSKGRQKRIDELNKQIEDEQAKIESITSKTAKKVTTGGLWDIFSNFISGIKNNSKISASFDSFGGWVTEKIGGLFGEGGTNFDAIVDTVSGIISGTSKNEKTTNAINETVDNVVDKFTGGENASKWNKMGFSIGDAIGQSILTGLGNLTANIVKPIMDMWHEIPTWLGGLSDESYNNWLLDHGFMTSADYKKSKNKRYSEWTLNTKEPTFFVDDKDKENYINQGIKIKLLDDKSMEYAQDIWSNKYATYFTGESLNNVRDYINKNNIQMVDGVYQITHDQYTEILKLLTTSTGVNYTGSINRYNNIKDLPTTSSQLDNWMNNLFGLVNYGNINRMLKDNGLNLTPLELASFFLDGFLQGWLQNIDGVLTVVGKDMDEVVKVAADHVGVASPSWMAEDMGKYFLEGFEIGIDEEISNTLDTMANATDLITDETIAGLNATQSMLDKDITPTITPIFDSSTLTNGVDTINSALDSVQPRVDSAIGSFGIESTDYTNNLTSLQNRIDNLTSVVDSFMTMIESGAGVNINVTAEADPTNIYNLVVDTNRTEFKRTGRNNLAY